MRENGILRRMCASVLAMLLAVSVLPGAALAAEKNYDQFTRISFDYPHAVASLKVGRGIKSEGELVISGTKGYIYVPSPSATAYSTRYFQPNWYQVYEHVTFY